MPRINVEEGFWSDPRFEALVAEVGDKWKAVGLAVCFWRSAQHAWREEKGIDRSIFDRVFDDALIKCGLARVQNGHIFAAGAQDAFKWLKDREEAGRRGGLSKASKRLANASCSLANAKQTLANPKQTLASSSSSSSLLILSTDLIPPTPNPTLLNEALSDFDEFWKVYPRRVGKGQARKAWKQTEGARPPIQDLISKIQELSSSESWMKDGGEFIPHPATWLRREGWLDELKPRNRALEAGQERHDYMEQCAAAAQEMLNGFPK